MKRLISFLLSGLMLLNLTGCEDRASSDALVSSFEMELSYENELSNSNKELQNQSDRIFPYRIVDREEATKLYLSNTDYFANSTPYDLQFKMQRKDATIEMLKEFGAKQMRDFSEKEKASLNAAMDEIEALLKEKKIHLPEVDEIQFIRSTQSEEPGTAYTHGTQIYMDGLIPIFLEAGESNHQKGIAIILHEIFHCLTRQNPEFRKEMYSIIGFQIADQEFVMPEAIRKISISNPDVEQHDAYAEFTIDGKKKKCYLVLISNKPFEKAGDSLEYSMDIALVPVDGEENGKEYYLMEDAEDFWDVFGKNTDYAIDPEECMADNFSFALTYGLDGGKEFRSPEILQGILGLIQ